VDLLHYPLAFIATLGVLVTIHEFGHYLVARGSGVRIVRFSVGFGRPLWSWVDKRGTEFALGIFPLGGYVRMFDDRDVDEAVEKPAGTIAYMDLHPGWRIAIALGGPAANFLMAIVVYWILAVAGSFNITPMVSAADADSPAAIAGLNAPSRLLAVDDKEINGWQEIGLALTDRLGETGVVALTVKDLQTDRDRVLNIPITAWHEGVGEPDVIGSLGIKPVVLSLVGDLVPDSPAQRGGLQTGDFVTAVDGQPVSQWAEWVEQIESHPNEAISLDLYRQGHLRRVSVTPGSRTLEDGTEVGLLGVYQSQIIVDHTPLQAVGVALVETWDKSILILSVVGKMVTGQVSVKNLSGPISIAQVAGDSARYSWRSFVGILAFLSLSLGVFNLLPIPILDGGHVLFNGAELLTGKPVPERVQIVGVQVGLFLVGALMIFATYNDLLRIF
jgi:regulator of sigma E protease